jgi:hypothetical protein
MVCYAHENHPILPKKIPRQLEAGVHHVEPVGVEAAGGFSVGGKLAAPAIHLAGEFKVVMDVVPEVVGIDELLAGIVGRIDVCAGNLIMSSFFGGNG